MTVQAEGLKPKDFLFEKCIGGIMKERCGILAARYANEKVMDS